ncbi:MAG: NAD-binding protein [Actinomycetota bacterium]
MRTRLAWAWALGGWPLVGALALGAFVLGFFGFRAHFAGQGVTRSTSDLAYLSLQLFVVESGSIPQTGTPWQLEIARLLAPMTAAAALVSAAVALFRTELAEVRLRRRSRHVVVCGLGARGSRLASRLADDGYQVVAVEKDGVAPAVSDLRRRGILVVVGDAREPETLRRARVDQASFVVAVTGTDDADAEIAVRSGRLASARRGAALTCLAHVRDPALCSLLRSEELAGTIRGRYRLDFFNVYEQGARALLDDHPPFDGGDGIPPRMLVIGLSPLGQSVIVEAARRWAGSVGASGIMQVTAVDPAAGHVLTLLGGRHPQLGRVARLDPVSLEPSGVDIESIASRAGVPPTAVYVCVDDDSVSLDVGLRAVRCQSLRATPVVVQLNRAGGLAELLRRPGGSGTLHVFDLLERTLSSDLLLGGTYEILARAIHEEYRSQQIREGATVEANPSVAPWDDLPESLKESNRDQASHIGTKLSAVGRSILPIRDWDAGKLVFSDVEVQRLSRMEHDRWVEQRRRDGWKLGAKDTGARTSPYLVPWELLDEAARDLDRRTVRNIPALLARAGYQVIPVPDPETRAVVGPVSRSVAG